MDSVLDRGRGRWMLNNRFLEDQEYIDGIKEIIHDNLSKNKDKEP